jgi:hypothetical protein
LLTGASVPGVITATLTHSPPSLRVAAWAALVLGSAGTAAWSLTTQRWRQHARVLTHQLQESRDQARRYADLAKYLDPKRSTAVDRITTTQPALRPPT